MLLALDIGNTNVTIGAFDGDRLVNTGRFATDARRMPDEYALQLQSLLPLKGIQPSRIKAVSICSVVPPLTGVFVQASRMLFSVEPLVVGAGTKTGVRVLYDNPRDVGADRVVDAAATLHFHGGPAVIVDFGTATTFNAVTADGSYLGGAITAGLQLAAEALWQNTSQLRRVELVAPKTAIGKSTVASMQSGIIFGYAALVEGMVRRFKAELEAPTAKVIATGGLAGLMAEHTNAIEIVDVDLTLKGLAWIHRLNTDPEPAPSQRGAP
ncbi:MAG: type III pantothenate kinase [SAR202 cluster bacterium]|nr:type III pantothenate kinase [SAR202 cluster bacterium]